MYRGKEMAEVFFNGPAGRIEGRYRASSNCSAPIALILHPHSQYGGNINNKVVYNLYKCFAENDFSVLRINFRGVGKSEGTFDKGIGELSDAAASMDWVQSIAPGTPSQIWSVGFSFGALIALQLVMRRPEISHFVSVSTPANKYDFGFLSPCPIPGLIAHGKNDSIADETSVSKLASRLDTSLKNGNVELHTIHGADHFFRDQTHMEELIKRVDAFVKQHLSLHEPDSSPYGVGGQQIHIKTKQLVEQ